MGVVYRITNQEKQVHDLARQRDLYGWDEQRKVKLGHIISITGQR